MAVKFMGKNPHKKYVRQIPNRNIPHIINENEGNVMVEPTVPIVDKNEEDIKMSVEETSKTKKKRKKNGVSDKEENNDIIENTEEKDMTNESFQKAEQILSGDIPEVKVKIEKKEKGLYERTENSTIMLTEDNKMLLND